MKVLRIFGLICAAYLMVTNEPSSFWFMWGAVCAALNVPVERLYPKYPPGTRVLVDWDGWTWEGEYQRRSCLFGFHEVRVADDRSTVWWSAARDQEVLTVRSRDLLFEVAR